MLELRRSDFEADVSWQSFPEPVTLTTDDLAFDVLAAGLTRAGDVPVLLINEPMFISQGQNSDLRYNGGVWQLNWATPAETGCYYLRVFNNAPSLVLMTKRE